MSTYVRILKYVKPYWPHLAGSIVCILFFIVFSSVTLLSIQPFLSTIFQTGGPAAPAEPQIPDPAAGLSLQQSFKAAVEKIYEIFMGPDWSSRPLESLHRLCIMLIAVVLLKSLFEYLQAYFMAFVEQGVIRDIRNDIYIHLNRLSLGFFHGTKTGELISRITNDVTLVNSGISASFFTLVKNPLLIIVYLSLAVLLSWQLSIIAFLILPFSLYLISWIGIRLRKESTRSQERMAEVTSVLQETIAGTRIVKAFAMEHFEIGKFRHKTNEYFRTLLRLTRTRNLASPLTEFLGTMVGVGVLWYGGQEVLKGHILGPEEFIFFLILVFSIMQPVKELSSVNNRIQEALAAGDRIFRILDTEPDVKENPRPVRHVSFKKSVAFRRVSFGYNPSEPVLQRISLSVRKGDVLAVVGPSGAGKSSLLDLLPRFYDPTAGGIEIDGVDIRKMRFSDLRSLMGIVTQETILFNDTVRNNIAYGLADMPMERIRKAAESANAHRFISRMKKGYDTVIGERGIKLSGGERQRLAIARALLKDPPILILDEATSSLDSESERLVQQAIDRLMENRTSFVVAHRLSTVQNADRIIVLDRGRIVEQGRHAELLRKRGLYKRLYDMQFRDEPAAPLSEEER
ncbi:ABC transporter ATP-binding protein [bacterium]|nr:ABC transporter ATP-binding protein [bacterium]